MKAIIWNVRGIGNKQTVARVRRLCRRYHPSFLIIIEPKVELNEYVMKNNFGFCNVMKNCNNHIWFFYNDDYDVNLISDHEQYLHVQMRSPLLPRPIFGTWVHAKCTREERQCLWDELRVINPVG